MKESPSQFNKLLKKFNVSVVTNIILLIVIVALSLTIMYMHKKLEDPWVVGFVDGYGTVKADVLDQKLSELNQPDYFIRRVLGYMYDWGPSNFLQQKNKAKKYMNNQAKQQFDKLLGENFYKNVKQNKISSDINIQRIFSINRKQHKNYNNLFKVEIDAKKIKVVNYIRKPIPVHITIYFRIVPITKDNQLGYQIVGFQEELLNSN